MIYLEPYKKYAVFEGRASRREFWTYKLFVCLFFIALIGASAIFASLHLYVLSSLMGIAMVLFSIFTIIPGIAVTFRRLHDTNRSGWFLLLFFIHYLFISFLKEKILKKKLHLTLSQKLP